jgi:uncharacterized membrane protein
MTRSNTNEDPTLGTDSMGNWIGVGAGLGVAFGVIYGNIGLGTALGAALGAVIGGLEKTVRRKRNADSDT